MPKYLSDEFVDSYVASHGAPPFGGNGFGEFVFLRTYSRWLPEQKRREYWHETIRRAIEYSMNLYQGPADFDTLRAEAEELFDYMYNLKAFPAGRTLWIGGTPAGDKFSSANFNCSFAVVDNFDAFCDAFYLLMVGAGVGFRVLKTDVEKLPHVNNKIVLVNKPYHPKAPIDRIEYTQVYEDDEDHTSVYIIVGDSKEGWIEALRRYFETIQRPEIEAVIINYDSVRPEGELLKTFGGRSSGHGALKQMFRRVDKVVRNSNGKLTPIQCMDIMNIVAASVVVGGVRRSSQICLFSPDDTDILNAKYRLFEPGSTNPAKEWRGMSNNSLFFEEKPGKEQLIAIFNLIANNGEPGFVNAVAARARRPWFQGLNPCVVGDTFVQTKQGHFQIKDLVGEKVEVWNGKRWVWVDNFRITAENQPVFDVVLHNGQTITATSYHTFILQDGSRKKLSELRPGDILLNHDHLTHGSYDEPGAYLKGFLIGDGSYVDDRPLLWLYDTKYSCQDRLVSSAYEVTVNSNNTNTVSRVGFEDSTYNRRRMTGLTARKHELFNWCTQYKKKLPIDKMLNWSLQSKAEFIAGVLDADGSASDTKNGFMYQITSISENFIKDFQLLLHSVGIKSKINLPRKQGKKDFGENRGGECDVKTLYRLTISQAASIHLSNLVNFSRLVSFANKNVKYELKEKSYKVSDIKFSHVAEKVYCCTIEDEHAFSLSNGVVIGQCGEILLADRGVCNLTDLVLRNFVDVDGNVDYKGLKRAIKLITRIGLRQTNVTLELSEWDAVQKRDRLVGPSLDGIVDTQDALDYSREDMNDLYTKLNLWANEEAQAYAKEMRVPVPLLVTTVKPSGSLSQLPTVSSGAHRSRAPYYVRRVRITASDPLARVMFDLGFPVYPEGVYEDEFDALGQYEKLDMLKAAQTWVIEFPIKSPTKIAAAEEPAKEQFARYLDLQKYWTDHNTSITIYFKPEEIEGLVDMILEKWDEYVAVSFLPYISTDKKAYPLMPEEEITKEEFEDRRDAIIGATSERIRELLTLYENEDLSTELIDDACATGACPTR